MQMIRSGDNGKTQSLSQMARFFFSVSTLLYYISELVPFHLHTVELPNSPHFIFFMQDLIVCCFFYPIIQFTHLQLISRTLHPPVTPPSTRQLAELPPKNGQTFLHLLVFTLSHLAVFQAFVLVTTHNPSIPCLTTLPSTILNHVYLYT